VESNFYPHYSALAGIKMVALQGQIYIVGYNWKREQALSPIWLLPGRFDAAN
jgi:hypothetical protein